MATDWLVYWLLGPIGLGLIGLVLLASFTIWQSALGKSRPGVGAKPLALGYAAATLGLAIGSLVSSYAEFSERARLGLLGELQRWEVVPGWTIYNMVISLVFVLPLLAFVCAPACASLLRRRRLSVPTILASATALWLAVATVFWAIPTNHWERTHRLEHFQRLLGEFSYGIVLIVLPFMFSVHAATRTYRRSPVQAP